MGWWPWGRRGSKDDAASKAPASQDEEETQAQGAPRPAREEPERARVQAVARAQEESRAKGAAVAVAAEQLRETSLAREQARAKGAEPAELPPTWRYAEPAPKRPDLIGDEIDAGAMVLELMRDPHEGPTVMPFLRGRPVTEAERAAYRDLLLERGDPRGEVLALIMELAAPLPPPDAERKRARLTELKPQISSQWLMLVADQAHLLNCGMGREHRARIRFAFKCPRSWEELTPTRDAGVRHCSGCGEDVHRVETVVAAEELARQRKCIAVPPDLAEQGGYPGGRSRTITGRPEHPVRRWADRLFVDSE